MKRLSPIAAVAVCTALAGPSQAQEQEKKPEAQAQAPAAAPGQPPAVSPAFTKTVENLIAVCAACHTEEDMARYETLVGPMVAMMHPMNAMHPGAYPGMMAPMMDPKVYNQWMNTYTQKYGTYMDPRKSVPQPGAADEPKN
ncbi:MAG: hypothetical protein OES09_16235 [Gammaproteobacteria bacterium]|nr:hypothetical protein [Gammaproteobacteria bacterium]